MYRKGGKNGEMAKCKSPVKVCFTGLFAILLYILVELQGVEPWSIQAAKTLSTCLSFD